MFAVIKTGGKQYRVQKGEILDVEKLDTKEGEKISFEEVLLIEDDGKIQIGTPYLKDAVVKAEVLTNFKDKKVIVFKKKRRKQYRRTKGHRQELTKIRVEEILSSKVSVKAKPASEKKPSKAAAKPKAKAVNKVKAAAPGKKAASSSKKSKPATKTKPAAPKRSGTKPSVKAAKAKE